MINSEIKRITGLVRKAVEDYGMIADGDGVAVGVSGGKDSLVLLCALSELAGYYPKHFTVKAITLDMGYNADYSQIQALCDRLGVEYIIKKTNIKEVVFDIRREKNPCSLCAKMRRGALNDAALAAGCRKVALGHHSDDVLETFMLSLIYEGRVSCFSPVTHLDRTGVYQIRPLIYVNEREIKGAVNKGGIPVVHNPCPANGETKREYMKQLIRRIEQETQPGLKRRLFTAIQNSGIEGWDR